MIWIKIAAVIFTLSGLFLYIIIRGSARSMDENMQRKLDEEQARIVSEISKRHHSSKDR